jgi:hypothetical protein
MERRYLTIDFQDTRSIIAKSIGLMVIGWDTPVKDLGCLRMEGAVIGFG